ncbi:MAG: hypothetical protein AB1757_15370 [Acidobacteriota bacterium]
MAITRYWRSRWWAETLKPKAQQIAAHPRAEGFVFFLELAGITLFPIPVALILVALVTAAPRKWFRFALSASVGSIIGSIILYLIGSLFFQSIGEKLIHLYGASEKWMSLTDKFDGHFGITFILVAGMTTGFMRIACIAAGFSGLNPILFIMLLAISRSVRFVAECGSIKYVGDRVQTFPKHYYKYGVIGVGVLVLVTLAILTFIN